MVVNQPATLPPRRALIVVDVQNDFCEGGNLAVAGGAKVAANVTRWIEDHSARYEVIVATADWHTDHTEGHFAPSGEDPDYANTWPVHCMAEGSGSDFHPDLALPEGTEVFRKGQRDASYSGFDGATDAGVTLSDYLRSRGITHVDVLGIAFDFCVKETAIDARREGFKARVLKALTASVSPETEREALERMSAAGVELVREGAVITAPYAQAR